MSPVAMSPIFGYVMTIKFIWLAETDSSVNFIKRTKNIIVFFFVQRKINETKYIDIKGD